MLDRTDKILIAFLTTIILSSTVISVIAINRLEEKSDQCNDREGIMIKSEEGWTCIEREIVID